MWNIVLLWLYSKGLQDKDILDLTAIKREITCSTYCVICRQVSYAHPPAWIVTSLGLVLFCSLHVGNCLKKFNEPKIFSWHNAQMITPILRAPLYFGWYSHDGYQNRGSWHRWIDSRAQFHSCFLYFWLRGTTPFLIVASVGKS